jgi:hypothetical protein
MQQINGDPHLHLYGGLTPGQALDLAQGHAVDWGWLAGRWRDVGLTPPDFASLAARQHAGSTDVAGCLAAAMADGPAGFAAFQAHYDLVIACSRWASGRHDRWSTDTASEITHVCALVAQRGPAQVRILIPGTATAAWVEAALEHLATATRSHRLELAISLPRADPLRHWPLVAAAAQRHAHLTGIDLCGIEDEPAQHARLAAAIAGWNASHAPRRLDLLVHVGEQLRAVQPLTALRRVWDAVALGADRLGHALAARIDPDAWPTTPAWERCDERVERLRWLQWQAEDLGLDADAIDHTVAELGLRDPASQLAAESTDPGLLRACQDVVLERIRSAGRIIEVCPTSNQVISGIPVARHGIQRLREAGVAWVIGSDDPGILGTTLATEQALLRP